MIVKAMVVEMQTAEISDSVRAFKRTLLRRKTRFITRPLEYVWMVIDRLRSSYLNIMVSMNRNMIR